LSLLRKLSTPSESRSGFTLEQLGKQIAGQRANYYFPPTVETALTDAAVWACVDVLSGSVGSLPLDAVRKMGEARLSITPTPAVIAQPSKVTTIDVWLYQLMQAMTTDGNGFGIVTSTDRLARAESIELVNPSQVTDRKVVNGIPQACVDGKEMQLYPYGDLWHVPGKMVVAGSPFALSPIEYAGNSIRAALSAEKFGYDFFKSGGHPTTVLSADYDPGPTEGKNIIDRFIESADNRRPVFVGGAIKVDKLSIDPKDSQFIELLRFCTEQVARFFRVPPSMIFSAVSGESVTYANVSQADLHYLKHSLDVYLVRIENALSALLAPGDIARFNRNALLRADAETRNRVYDMRLKNGSLTKDEVRALEDEPPLQNADDQAARAREIAELIQKIYLGVNVVLTADEAREIANQAGAGLSKSMEGQSNGNIPSSK
jgi:HK97 family phage portal protein